MNDTLGIILKWLNAESERANVPQCGAKNNVGPEVACFPVYTYIHTHASYKTMYKQTYKLTSLHIFVSRQAITDNPPE